MVFNSLTFVVFFLIFLLLYASISNTRQKRFLIIAANIVYFSFAGLSSIFCVLLVSLLTWLVVNQIRYFKKKVLLLYATIAALMLMLFGIKYLISYNFTAELLGISPEDSSIPPLGLSFYSLQAVGLLLDKSNGIIKEQLGLIDVLLFISFFPQSAAGPIHRGTELIPQFLNLQTFNGERAARGFKTILKGFFLKLVAADKLGLVISPVLDRFQDFDGSVLALATLLFSLQIYFDFWGYSLIAIGLGQIIGFRININFNNPYLVVSFKEFWHRWHISLSNWMRDYIYLPLGGKNKDRYGHFILAISTTFIFSSAWHGFSTNYLLWGLLHSFLYLNEDLIRRNSKLLPFQVSQIRSLQLIKDIIQYSIFFIIISLTWLVFRTTNLIHLEKIFLKILHFSNWNLHELIAYYFIGTNAFYVLIVILTFILSNVTKRRFKNIISINPFTNSMLESVILMTLFFLLVLFGGIESQKFIYFSF